MSTSTLHKRTEQLLEQLTPYCIPYGATWITTDSPPAIDVVLSSRTRSRFTPLPNNIWGHQAINNGPFGTSTGPLEQLTPHTDTAVLATVIKTIQTELTYLLDGGIIEPPCSARYKFDAETAAHFLKSLTKSEQNTVT